MNAKDAKGIISFNDGRKIFSLARRHGALTWIRHFQAKGYLEALEGPEVRALVEALNALISCVENDPDVRILCPEHLDQGRKALAKYREEIK